MTVRLQNEPFIPGDEIEAFRALVKGAGAIVSFLGSVRDMSMEPSTDNVRHLYLEHHAVLTRSGIETAIGLAGDRWPLLTTLVIHRIGRIDVYNPIVLVCAASKHRKAAFEATDFLMDYLKTEALFWKKESRASGDMWIDPSEADYQQARRWSD